MSHPLTPFRHALAYTALLLIPGASAACLSDAPTPGLSSGPITVQAVPKNKSALTVHSAELCQPQSFHIEGETAGGSGYAAFTGNNNGIASYTSASANGPGTGTTYAGSQGSVAIVFRVDTLSGYTGGTTIDITINERLKLSGSSTATGAGAVIGGTYETEVTLRPLVPAPGILLGVASGSILFPIDETYMRLTTIEANTDFVLSYVHTQNAISANGQDTMGFFGSSAVSATTQRTLEIELTTPDATLALSFPMVQALGLAAPNIDAVIPLTIVPVPGALVLMPGSLLLLARRVRRGRHIWRAQRPAQIT